MGFFQKLKNELKLKKEYRKIFCPFLNAIKKELFEFKTIENAIPLDVTQFHEKIKTIDNKRYIDASKEYSAFYDAIKSHNEEIVKLEMGMIGFNKQEVLDNALSYDYSTLEKYYDVASKISKYNNLNDKQIDFKNNVFFLYNNFELIKKQKKLLSDKELIYKKIINNNNYLDYEFIKPLANIDENIVYELQKNEHIFYDFSIYNNFKELVDSHNKCFIESNIKNPLFDDVNGKSLDNEQRKSIITDELSTLVVAGAGSGKTLTICGKVEYLVKEKGIKPEEILLLSYSKKSADDLQRKIGLIDSRLTVGTFHKIGLDILKETGGKVLTVEEQYKAIIEKYFREEMKNRNDILEKILSYYGLYISAIKHEKKYESEGELFEDLKKQNFATLKNQLISISGNSIERKTIKKEYVKSFEELTIANWYFINGIDYIYEFPYKVDLSTIDKRQYTPDFFLPKYNIYHEHYGIDKLGKANQFKGEEADKYVENIQWKRKVHADNNTTCIETYSYEFKDGTIFAKLEEELRQRGVEFHSLTKNEIVKALESIYEGQAFKSFINLISSFLSLYKAKYRNDIGFYELSKYSFGNQYNDKRSQLFLEIVKDVYHYYKEYLANENKIDFDDMILESMELLDKTNNYKYKYILVDEFQDISYSRMLFLKKLIAHGHSKLFSVGDDWQAIYRFSGCDLNIFLKFSDYFGASEIKKITTTHRNSQELQDTAGQFVMKNDEQIKKRINSDKHLDNPIGIMYYTDKKYYAFLDVLREINKLNRNANVLVLGRNNKDFDSISLDERIFIDYKKTNALQTYIKVKEYPNMKITYSTVHGSKGLEEDFVILINAEDSKVGFPNKMEDDELLDMVLSSKSKHEFAEERRLWYVALTRTRSYVYLLVNIENPSIFVDDIIDKCYIINSKEHSNHSAEIECPYCKTGRLVLRTREKDNSKFYGCSNYPYCKYTIDDFKAIKRNKHCIECGDFLIYKKGQWGAFLGCHSYPRCHYTEKFVPDEWKNE